MFLKAMLLCEDVRVEASGTITLIGVFNERMLAPPGEGPIRLARFACFATVGGLKGQERIGFRQRMRDVNEPEATDAPYAIEKHDPAHDEHNFVFGDAPMTFPGPGTYEVALDVDAGVGKQTFRYRFSVER